MRELVWMADGKEREAWNHTAALLAQVDRFWRMAGDPMTEDDYHPFRRAARVPPPEPSPDEIKRNWSVLKNLVQDGKVR